MVWAVNGARRSDAHKARLLLNALEAARLRE
jgi:hypothetical protein